MTVNKSIISAAMKSIPNLMNKMCQFSNNLLPTLLSESLMEQMYEFAANRHARGLSLYPC